MKSRFLVRPALAALVAAAALTVAHATIGKFLYATPISFTTGSTQSTVEVIASNPNTVRATGTLTLVLDEASGVPRTWNAGPIDMPRGNSVHRVVLPGAITGVRRAALTNLRFF